MIRMNEYRCRATLKAATVVSAFLLFGAVAGFGQQQINLTAGPTTTTLPDGTTVPMWGYFCGGAVTGSTATCAALNPSSTSTAGGTWSPVVITVPTGQGLTINLTNNLSFTPAGSSTPNNIPTSIVIVGQVGGGLGTARTTTPSPSHTDAQGCVSWFIADPQNTPPGTPCTTSSPLASPPAQGPRVQSMATEVAAGVTTPTSLTWGALRPGTYLLESGTHPSIQVPMGLIGMLVVTTAPSSSGAGGVAYPSSTTAAAVPYNTEVPLEFSEIDPVQNAAVDQAVRTAGFSETAVWTAMNAPVGITALTLTNPGSGYTSAPSVSITGSGGTGATATATVQGVVSTISVTAGGTNYSATPTITINDSTGSGATAQATVDMTTGAITAITVTNPGSSYTAPTVAITDATGTGASATAAISGVITALTLTNAGSGYTAPPLVSFTGGGGSGALATATVTLGGCGGSATHNCYPPAVNYTPFYYFINGVAFNKTNPALSLFQATPGDQANPVSGTVLVRLVNASPRMHVPSIIGSLTQGLAGTGATTTVSGFTLIAEDGNVLPNVAPPGATTVPAAPRVQTDVFMAAGKTYDVMINAPQPVNGAVVPALPIYDRQLSLSGNSSERDAGMLAYISVNNAPGAGLPATAGTGVFAPATANDDTYSSLVAGQPFTVSDPAKGVIANDVNVYGVTLLSGPSNGTLSCGLVGSPTTGNSICANGTFTYTPNPGSTATSDQFTYCANNGLNTSTTPPTCPTNNPKLMATVILSPSSLSGGPTAGSPTYTAKMATYIRIPSPGLLVGSTDPNNLPLSVVVSNPTVTLVGVTGTPTVVMDAKGGFFLSVPGNTSAGTASFSFTVQNSQGGSASGTATVNFPAPNGPTVNVLDAQAYNNCAGNPSCISGLTPFSDYRWIIEEDKTFWVDPNCTTNTSINTPGCPSIVGPSGSSTVPTFGVNFHTSNMDFVAQGCTGPLSCEGGQTMLDTRPACTAPGVPTGCSTTSGQHIPAVCDVGNGACRPDTSGNGFTPVWPSQVVLDPAKRYYISVLPGDAANPFPSNVTPPSCNGVENTSIANAQGTTACGHTMGGAPIPPACNILGGPNACGTNSTFSPVTVLSLPTPLPTGKLSVIVFEDDFPLNGEQDGGGGNGVVAPIEPGLGGFNIVLWDTYGGLGDVTGQNTNDMFNQSLSNSLAGTIDPLTGVDACPISPVVTTNVQMGDGSQQGITGMIVTCPKYEADGQTLSPLAGQAVIANLMPEKFSVQAYPGADRIARGEEWIQTNTLDGQHPHDSFIRIGEPSYFQEYGPAGYHVSIGFANPAIINARLPVVCAGAGSPGSVGPCTNSIDGQVDVQRLSRTPDQRLYASGSRDALTWTQCWVSLGDPDGEDFMFTKCDANGNFKFTGVPSGFWRLTIGDQWNDQIIDGLSTPANVGCTSNAPNGTTNATTCPGGQNLHMGNIGVQQWQANLYTRTFIDANKNGIWDKDEIGIPLIYTMIHYRDGHNSNALTTDFNGIASFNETFPLFNWYVVEADTTRYKRTGTHTVYDAGGPADGSNSCGNGMTARQCGTSTAYSYLANTFESVPLPSDLSVPGAVYCGTADCGAEAASFQAGKAIPSSSTASTGRIDPPWVWAEGWSGMTSQGNWIDFGMAPYASCPPACATVTSTPAGATSPTTTQVGENGGIQGKVIYASTRPFDTAQQMIQQPWEPNVPRVTINLYQEGFAADGVTPTLTMVDTTQTSSWDDWAQGFYPNSTATPGTGQNSAQKPYMSCPGQGTNTGTNADLFYFTLFDQPNYLDWYNSEHNGGTLHTLPYNSQFKCYDAMHIWNQVQPAPYDGRYFFPSSLGIDPTTGKPVGNKGATNGVASSMPGTNCTVCVGNPDSTDNYRFGTPMLPPGKYVVEVIMPPGYELYKEEDKNLLIGDNYIAPVTQEFAGLGGDIFILPDQANVASLYDPNAAGYNPNNFQDQTANLNLQEGLSGVPGFPGFFDHNWPCVGEMRVVPDFLSIFPQVQETAPFAGATRPLCDRKEVTLANEMSVSAKFFIYTSTHIAAKFTGVITDDFTSEFDPFAPQFGEKFAPPNMPISTKDYLGNEVSRVYSDHWGIYDGLTFSSWEVNPPNITGYSPSMMTQCMNDPGPIPGPNGQMITDPLYNPAYSNFCYEEPYMPGLTAYLDTPVVPTQAFVGAAYNNPDCSYPDATPAIKEVDGDGIGPWVSASGPMLLTITALGDQQVTNSAYSGPSASAAPFNQKTVTHHYGFGGTQGTVTLVGSDGVAHPLTNVSWSDTLITGNVPSSNGVPSLPNCTVQQQTQYGGSAAQCGQLVITAANGKQSVDTVTVTIGGKPPTHVAANQSIQGAIDAANPGDLIIIDPTCTTSSSATTGNACSGPGVGTVQSTTNASHTEMVIMWKPVRLQGVGAVTSVINANASPAGKLLDPWRLRLNCLFGLTPSGVQNGYDPSCGSSWNGWIAQPYAPQIDHIPLEATIGWDATLNGNLAEQLQEPSLMGAYEGAGITVLAKGVDLHGQPEGSEGTFPAGTTLLSGVGPDPTAIPTGDGNPLCIDGTNGANRFPSNFICNPSSIDGLSVTNSSQGGGGVFVHGWAHYLQIANNRVYNNAGTLTGGISVGQGEFPDPYVVGGTNNPPGSCSDGTGVINVPGQHLPQCLQLEVNVHNNFITNNSSLGDELFSATLAGGGGVTFCTGNDYYKFNYNWVCGNLSSGEGGGVVHLGEIQNGDIEHNSIIFNQSSNPTIPTNGGGLQIMGTPDTDPVCGTQVDADCPPGLSDGIGHNLTVNANLIQGNSADSGSGGGIRLQQVNGSEVSTFPGQPNLWNNVTITNNIIVNNIAGWDGAGISLQDALNVSIVNNTIVSNDSLASSGVLTQSIGTPQASAPPGNCVQSGPSGPSTASCPQSAGVTSTQNSTLLTTTFTGLTLTCPFGQTGCAGFSNPLLANNVIWQNRSFQIGVGTLGSGNLNQQNLVSLFNAFTGTAAPVQTATGQCGTGASYWDIGVRGDTGPSNHGSGFTLSPMYSLLDDPADYSGGSNIGSDPKLVSQYCNGSRVPPECSVADGCGGPSGYGVPPGIVDASAPNPVFSLTPSATVDEGNNWINISWGPLSLTNPALTPSSPGYGTLLGNYAPNTNSPLIDAIGSTSPTYALAPTTDFFGNPRPDTKGEQIDIGAIEVGAGGTTGKPAASVSPTSLALTVQYGLSGSLPVTVSNVGDPGSTVNVKSVSLTGPADFVIASNNCTSPLVAPGGSCTISVAFTPKAAITEAASLTITTDDPTNTTITVPVNGTGTPAPLTITANNASKTYGTTLTFAGTEFTTSTLFYSDTVTHVTLTSAGAAATASVAGSPYPIVPSAAVGTGLGNYTISYVNGGLTVTPESTTTTITAHTPNSQALYNNVSVTAHVAPTVAGTPTGTVTIATNTTPADSCTATLAANGNATCSLTLNNPSCATTRTLTATYNPPVNGNFASSTSAGVSEGITFPTPTLTSISPNGVSPNFVYKGDVYSETITGRGLCGTTAITVSNGGVTPGTITVVNDTQVTTPFTISPTGNTGIHNVRVTARGLQSSSPGLPLTVSNPPTATLTGISPNNGLRSATAPVAVPVTLSGTNFTTNGMSVAVSGTGVTVSNIITTNVGPGTNTLTATFTIATSAASGARNVTVTNPNGTASNAVTFTVNPTLTSISPNGVSPNFVYRGDNYPVTFTGTNLTGSTGLTGLRTGMTVSNFQVVNSTTVTATINISGTTGSPGTANLAVVTPNGNTNTLPFTVSNPGLATVSGLSTTSFVRGTTTTSVTVTGTNFTTNGTTVAVAGNGVTTGAVNVTSSTSLTATFTVTAGATLGSHNVTVNNPGGNGTVGSTITVTGATASFSAPSPALTTTPANTTTKKGSITVTNTATGANAGPITLTAASTITKVSGPASGTFSILPANDPTNPTTCVVGAVVNPGGTCTIGVQYAPGGSTATATANVSITGSGLNPATQTSSPNFSAN